MARLFSACRGVLILGAVLGTAAAVGPLELYAATSNADDACSQYSADYQTPASAGGLYQTCVDLYTGCAGSVSPTYNPTCASQARTVTDQKQNQQAAQKAAQAAQQAGGSQNTTAAKNCTGKDCNLSYVPLEPLPSTAGQPDYANLAQYLNYAFPIMIAAGALIGVATLTIAGVLYMTSEVVETKSLALERIQKSIWGLLLLIASVLILHTINPNLTNFDLSSIGKLGSSSSNQSPASQIQAP